MDKNRVDRWLKEHDLALVIAPERIDFEEETDILRNFDGPVQNGSIDRYWTKVIWENRSVVASDRCWAHQDGFLIHEIIHAAYEAPPHDMRSESQTWMYAAELKTAGQWGEGWVASWRRQMRETPVDKETGGQELWKNMSDREQRLSMRGWMGLLYDTGLFRDKTLWLPMYTGQRAPKLGWGLHFF